MPVWPEPDGALEFGVGTGRVALPLSHRGIRVTGVELSPAMIAVLEQDGEGGVEVVSGDFVTTRVDGPFSLVYLVRNTVTNVITLDEQVETFRNAASHLLPGRHFLIENYVPRLQRLPPGESTGVFAATREHVGFEENDVAAQIAVSHHYWIVDGELRTFSSPHRPVWPSELDLMARLAGMELSQRWGDWHRSPFTSESTSHVSVWRKPQR